MSALGRKRSLSIGRSRPMAVIVRSSRDAVGDAGMMLRKLGRDLGENVHSSRRFVPRLGPSLQGHFLQFREGSA